MKKNKGKKGKGAEEEEKQPFAPEREPLEKPYRTPEQELVDLIKNFQEKCLEYFPDELNKKFQSIFNLFDRDYDNRVSIDELQVKFTQIYRTHHPRLDLTSPRTS